MHRSITFRAISLLVIIAQLFAFMPVQAAVTTPQVPPAPDAQTAAAPAQTLDHPLSLSRLQSSYTAGTTTITFVLTNNLPATRLPDISPSTTPTDTVNILAAFNPTDDVNTLRGLTLADTLAAGTTFVSASDGPVQSGSTITWSLPDLPPQASATLTLTVQTPAAGSNFINLDSGAQASATYWGQTVSVTAHPATIIPTGIAAAYTTPTLDANSHDADMLWKSAEFAQDPLALFAFVRGFAFDPYPGSLRGTRGTLWNEAGNSLDQSSLLIAMLRAAGIPARYRHGTLSTADAQVLINGMFPAAQGVAGYLPAGAATADPANDAALLALVQDHWWVEAYLPASGWTNLDPSFAEAEVGDVFATPGSNDRLAELPDATRQRVTFALEVEQYSSFPVGGLNLTSFTPLTATFAMPELAAKAVTFGHIVNTAIQGGVVTNILHTYTPYFAVGGDEVLFLGDDFQDLLTNFPLASHFTLAEWLHVTIQDGNGNVTDSFTRELKDLLGLETRLHGGNPVIALPADNAPFATFDDLFAAWFLPNALKNQQYARKAQAENARAILATAQMTQNLPADLSTPAGGAALREMMLKYIQARNEQYALAGLEFAKLADSTQRDIEASLRVKWVYEQPRVIIASSARQSDGSVYQALDLRSTEAKIVVAPGQSPQAAFSAQWLKGVAESYFEGQAIFRLTGQAPLTVSRLFDEMAGQGIQPVWIAPGDTALLGLYFSGSSYAYAEKALLEGKAILIPAAPVMVDGAAVLGWWEVDPQTGQTVSVMENGLHLSAVEYEMLSNIIDFALLVQDGAEIQQAVSDLWTCIEQAVVPALRGNPGGPTNCLDGWSPPGPGLRPQAASWRYLPAYLCPGETCGIEQFALRYPDQAPIPLPEIPFGYHDGFAGESWGGRVIEVTDGGGGSPAFSLDVTPPSGSVLPGETHTFDISAAANFAGLVDVWAYAPDDFLLTFDETTLEALVTPLPGVAAGNYTVRIVGQARQHPEATAVIETTISVSNANAITLDWQAEPNISVPVGAALLDAKANETNDGESEVPNAAYRLQVENLTSQPKTITLNITGAPADWLILNGERQSATSLSLAPNARATLGLYVSPPTLPAPGTSLTLNLSASDGSALSDSATINWLMPSQPFNFVTFQPSTLYLAPNTAADFDLSITNVGNAPGSFPLNVILPPNVGSVTGLTSPVTLDVGASAAQTATFTAASDLPLGVRFPLVIGSPAPGSYTQYALANVQIVSELSGAVFQASENAATVCTLGEPGLSAALNALALAMTTLESACQNGDCHPIPRDQVVSAAYSVALYAGAVHDGLDGAAALVAAADSLAAHTDPADVTADLQAISAAVTTLDGEVCAWSQHAPELRWTPFYGAALTDQTLPYTLTLTNRGSLQTTYAFTVSLPGGTLEGGQVTLDPGGTETRPYNLVQPAVGVYDLEAAVTVVAHGEISAYSPAKFNVVDKFVQITAVRPTPAFVETGSSSTTLFVDVANIANIVQNATARAAISAPDGTLTHSSETPVTIRVGAPRSYELQTVDTSGWAAGIYTVTVELLDGNGSLIPTGSNYAYLGVGQLLGVSHSTTPLLVPPGEFTVTTAITTEIIIPGIVPQNHPITQSRNQNSAINNQQSEISFPPLAPQSTFAITRTQNAALAYTGSWATVSNIFASHLSDGSYTASATPGDTASLAFNGAWVHIGFAKARNGGIAEIFVDGISRGTVDLYHPVQQCFISECASSAAFSGLGEGAHTLEIVVTGQSHPNASGAEIKIDYVDTWDGTLYPDGLYEHNDPRIMIQPGAWFTVTQAEASGGSYMQDGAINNNQSAWLPFTGDSASFVALARYDSHRVHVWVDGVWQGDVLIYAGQPVTRTYSFSGFGPGPHVMQIGTFRGEANVDAFITPAVGPDYDPPSDTGLVRYEEDHPALRYNGSPFTHRPNTWGAENAPQASEYAYAVSNTPGNTVSFDFYGSWLEIGLRTRNRGGLADVSIDGVSYGSINAYTPGEDVAAYPFDVITGTHTVTITVLGISDPPNGYNQVYLDYVEFWDGSPVSDDFQNARRGQESARVHVSSSASDAAHPNAFQGDFVDSGLPNSNSNVWYSFVGDSVTVYGLSVNDNTHAEIYIDGVLTDTIRFDYPFSVQPLAFHYTGLPYGPHSIRVHNVWEMRVDGFAANQPALPYQPIAEWWDDTPAGNGAPFFGTYGIAAGMAVGDVDADGRPEIVVSADDVINFGTLFVYRGDGGDTGDGDPIVWSHDFGGGTFRTWVSSPALGDLDGLPGAEIVVAAGDQLYAFHGDGSTYWVTDTVSIFETLTAPAIANLDLDPEPEIVVNAGNRLEVRAHDGELLWSTVYPQEVNPPVLADLTGDGLLDIVLTGWDDEVFVYDFNYGSPQLAWSATLTSTMAGTFGAPAVADIDGAQPGGDPGPEAAFAHNGALTVLDGPDGALLWTTPLEAGNPGGVSIADIDGDGEIEIVTGMKHEFETGRFGKLYALNADGSLLWSVIAEDSTSANNAAVMDLDGDGIYEVAWNGKEQGFTIFDGATGDVLFDEPLANSFTGTDYPLIADVDNDGQAEVVVAALRGLRVFGNGPLWTEARPLWNQHSYHITNINDDLSLPFSEPNSWEVHNTYRTQTHLRYPMLSFAVALTHTVGLDSLTVLTDTFNVQPSTLALPTFTWDYAQTWETPVITRTFDVQLADLQPGETRLVAQATSVDYTLPSGQNHLELPPLYVSVPHIIALDPAEQAAPNGATVTFNVTLSNPGPSGVLYTPGVTPLPGVTWGPLDPVNVPANSAVTVPLTAAIAPDATPASLPFGVFVDGDQAGGILTLTGPALLVEITPDSAGVPTGETAAYTLTVTNLEAAARTYDLAFSGLAVLDLPAQVSVPANSAAEISFSAQAVSEGGNPFTVIAAYAATGASASATAVISGEGAHLVAVTLDPATAASGPGALTALTVVIANLGSLPDTYNLSAALPAGWSGQLTLLGQPVSAVLVAPGAGNAVTLQWLVSPAATAAPGSYAVGVTAQSARAAATGDGVVQVGSLGVSVAFTGGPASLQPDGSGVWQVNVSNPGSSSGTFDLAAFGPLAAFATLSPASVTLNAGQSQTVQVTVSGLDGLIAGAAFLGLHAQSTAQPAIEDQATTEVTITPLEGVELAWQPATQSIESGSAAFGLVVTNTGSTLATLDLSITSDPAASLSLSSATLTLPAHATATLLVWVTPSGDGTYTLTATATGSSTSANATATLTMGEEETLRKIYLPLIFRNGP